MWLLGNVSFTQGTTEVERLSHWAKGFRDGGVEWFLPLG